MTHRVAVARGSAPACVSTMSPASVNSFSRTTEGARRPALGGGAVGKGKRHDDDAAARAVAMAIRLARSRVSRVCLGRRIIEDFGYDLAPERALAARGFDVSAKGTVASALAAAFAAEDWEGAVRAAISRGGDTDTLACIAGAVAEALYGLPAEIARRARGHLTDDLGAVLKRFEAARAA